MLLFLLSMAHANPDTARLYGGLSGLSAPPGGSPESEASVQPLGAGVLGRVTIPTSFSSTAIDLQAREVWEGSDPRLVGALFFGARLDPGWPVHVRLGFAHNHEIPAAVLQVQPVLAVLGSAEGIRHRSGLEVGIGRGVTWTLPQPLPLGLHERLGAEINLSGAWFPDPQGPSAYVFLDVAMSVGVGKLRGEGAHE
jgi:hypothetical protein